MEVLPCVIFVNSKLYEMYDDVRVWGRGQNLTALKYFNYVLFFYNYCN